ncbi:MAG: OmpA family protein [Rhodobacteraceae bacterium]|nr:OmpA family protein [Paracoccaceae bacterium]
MKKLIIICAAALSLTACSYEAGGRLDQGNFGNATMNNTLIQNGELSYVVELNSRFSQDVPPMINFDFDKATLDATSRAILDRQADWIKQFPEVRFRVYGHTDAVGSSAYNKRLGLRRAQAVVAYFASKGISRSRLEAIASFGETQPLIVTQGRERANRRTVTEVAGFVEKWDGELDGKYGAVIYRDYIGSAGSNQQVQQANAS